MGKKDKLAVYLTPEKKAELERRYHEDGSKTMTMFMGHALDFCPLDRKSTRASRGGWERWKSAWDRCNSSWRWNWICA